jgi:predicted Fe-Mo cluster-binding NifX family protein
MKNLKTFVSVLFLSTFFFQVQYGLSFTDNSKSSNKIAIATVGDSVNSEISKVAGRAPYYLIFDEKGKLLKSIKNPSQNRRGGASSVVVNLLLKESVKTFIAGKFGNKMVSQLKKNKIEYHECAGIAKENLKKLIKKEQGKNAKK